MLSDLFRTFRQGTAWLLALPLWTLSLVLLGTALNALAPWLQMRTGLPDHPVTVLALQKAATLPLSLYAIPRFILQVDAGAQKSSLNTLETTAETFETRWLPMLGANVVLWVGFALGALALIVPGLMILAAFGWAPTLVLLRGFDLRRAFRGSLKIMAQHTARVVFTVLGTYLMVLLVLEVFSSLLPTQEKDITPLFRLRSPLVWALNALGTLSTVWLSATLLALFQDVEEPAHAPEAAPEDED